MILNQLMDLQKGGAFKVTDIQPDGTFTLCGQRMNSEICNNFLKNIGWERLGYKPSEGVSRTDSWLRGFNKNLTNEAIMMNCNVSFSSIRRSDTEKYIERVSLVSEGMKLSIVKGTPGIGGIYALYDAAQSQSQPVDTFSSMKQLCEFLNEEY